MTSTRNAPPAPPRRSALLGWIAVVAVACGTFAVVTTEMLPVGLLSLIGPDIGVSTGASGQLLTTASVLGFLSSLGVLIVAGRLDRRLVLAGLMGLMLVANLGTALADNYPLLLGARILAGISIGGFWAVAVSMAVRLVPEHAVPRASSIIFSGVAIASVIGVPAGTFVGDHWGWRAAFGGMAALSLLVLVAIATLLPRLPSTHAVRPADMTVLLRNGTVRLGLLGALLVVTGHFAAYTYVTPVLRDSVGIEGSTVATLLLVYGVAGIAGNFIAGSLVREHLRNTMVTAAVLIAAATVAIPLLVQGTVTTIAALVVWGLGYGAAPVALQVWTLRSAPGAAETVSALYTAGFQLAIGGGAILGGLAVDTLDVDAPMWLGAVLAAATVAVILAAARRVLNPASTR